MQYGRLIDKGSADIGLSGDVLDLSVLFCPAGTGPRCPRSAADRRVRSGRDGEA